MFIQIKTDNQVESNGVRDARIEDHIRQRLARFEEKITDIEVHVSDLNGRNGQQGDLRCTLEARVTGIHPVAVAEEGATVDRAVLAAAKKAARALDRQLGKLDPRRGN